MSFMPGKACVILPPFYYKQVSDEGLFRFYAQLVEGLELAAENHFISYPTNDTGAYQPI